ncbi:hypothetical protein [Luteibacter sp. CQ10]|uniref:hypothetical protein n=1 Tax=Luteibacter sp. CQ10 TaxID=2805821 RepID=UPI0034A39432
MQVTEASGCPALTPDDFLASCTLLLFVLVIVARLLSLGFRYILERHIDLGPPGRLNVAHLRYEESAMVGKAYIPAGMATATAWVMRAVMFVVSVAACAWWYVSLSIHRAAQGDDLAVALNPSTKSPSFWAGYVIFMLWMAVTSLARIMVLRHDPRRSEATGRFDGRRFRMGLRMIFTDHPLPKDPVALCLRTICRWLILGAILDVLLIIAL